MGKWKTVKLIHENWIGALLKKWIVVWKVDPIWKGSEQIAWKTL